MTLTMTLIVVKNVVFRLRSGPIRHRSNTTCPALIRSNSPLLNVRCQCQTLSITLLPLPCHNLLRPTRSRLVLPVKSVTWRCLEISHISAILPQYPQKLLFFKLNQNLYKPLTRLLITWTGPSRCVLQRAE